ncbi:TonB-dependent receptor plug domain-containing protein [Janthinobacterium psychrotolerans]|uniref:Iron complex outermembrane recepter protein n=1 Tax=Janthinobacterium psychrotolerans TaxID=1747903 RepID=A0A1A7C2H0_9BURK|nr:TonB-dependent receptor [Janthinobacterium psychrotolerans]OBV40146.1 iron complex outermembrane recepter protein [Janthinobacterium psychrotolerans]
MRTTLLLCSLALPWPAAVRADDTLPSVTISVDRTAQRRNDTVSTITVGHDELIRQGDRALIDVLKRLPGVSVGGAPGAGQGQQIALHGLGQGYTLVMLDGVAVPNDFALDSLDPELVERVEIRRAATAEFSAQAIAGAINIVLKKAAAKPQREFKLGASTSAGLHAGSATLQWSGKRQSLTYALAGTLSRTARASDIDEWDRNLDIDGNTTALRHVPQRETVRVYGLELAPRLSWAMADEASLAWQSLVSVKRLATRHLGMETAYVGGSSSYPDNHSDFDQESSTVRSDLQWLRKLGAGASLDVKLGVNYNHRSNDFVFEGRGPGPERVLRATHLVDSGVDDAGVTFSGSYRLQLGEHHLLAAGWDAGRRRRADFRRERQLLAGAEPALSDEAYAATAARLALYAQDEWEVSARWSLYLGLRWEGLRTASGQVNVRSQVWSPLLQSLWKLRGEDQLRLALTRTYKAPEIFELLPRRYTVDNGNSATNPDTRGNPALRPELAWGIDAAYEYYPAKGVLLGLSGSLRQVKGVMRDQLYLAGERWVATPVNGGDALVRGLELEAKLPLGAVDLRANLARNWSRVTGVPGPDNRLDSQLPWSASAGGDYRLARLPLSLGASFTYQAGVRARISNSMLAYAGVKRELDAYALWKWSDKLRLRMSGANLLGQRHVTRGVFDDGDGRMLRSVSAASDPTWRLMLEGSL